MSQVARHLIDLFDVGLDFVLGWAQNQPESFVIVFVAVMAVGIKIILAMSD